MNKTQEKAFCKAMTLRLHEYEEVIAGKKKFVDAACPICKSFGGRGIENCRACPLNPCSGFEDFYKRPVQYIFKYYSATEFLSLAKARYYWLIKKIEEAGYSYE
jgi:hypothetical protein